jgi:hypothetical protein
MRAPLVSVCTILACAPAEDLPAEVERLGPAFAIWRDDLVVSEGAGGFRPVRPHAVVHRSDRHGGMPRSRRDVPGVDRRRPGHGMGAAARCGEVGTGCARPALPRDRAHADRRDLPRPGDTWGGYVQTNPSYFSPAYYRVFAEVTDNVDGWQAVIEWSYTIIENSLNADNGACRSRLRTRRRPRPTHAQPLLPALVDRAVVVDDERPPTSAGPGVAAVTRSPRRSVSDPGRRA